MSVPVPEPLPTPGTPIVVPPVEQPPLPEQPPPPIDDPAEPRQLPPVREPGSRPPAQAGSMARKAARQVVR